MSDLIQQTYLNKSRKDKFLFTLNLPNALKGKNSIVVRDDTKLSLDALQFSVYGTIVPKIEKPAVEIRYSGNTLYNSAHSIESYPPVTVDFTIDNRYNNYWAIYSWLNLMHDQVDGTYDSEDLILNKKFENYQADFILTALDEFDKPIISFTYTKAFPTELGEIEYSYRSGDEIQCSFTFVYSQLKLNLINS
jgi:hypothetical protein